MGAMNTNPTSQSIKDNGGELLKILGGEEGINDVREQFFELLKQYDPKKQSTVEPLKALMSYLGNLYSIPEAEELTEENIENIEKMLIGLGEIIKKAGSV